MKKVICYHLEAEEFNDLIHTHFSADFDTYNYFEYEEIDRHYGHYDEVQSFNVNRNWSDEDEAAWQDMLLSMEYLCVADLFLKKLVIDGTLPEGRYLIGNLRA